MNSAIDKLFHALKYNPEHVEDNYMEWETPDGRTIEVYGEGELYEVWENYLRVGDKSLEEVVQHFS